MLVVLPPIFVADTKIIYGDNFIAPLNLKKKRNFKVLLGLIISTNNTVEFLDRVVLNSRSTLSKNFTKSSGKAVIFLSCFLDALLRHNNKMFNCFYE